MGSHEAIRQSADSSIAYQGGARPRLDPPNRSIIWAALLSPLSPLTLVVLPAQVVLLVLVAPLDLVVRPVLVTPPDPAVLLVLAALPAQPPPGPRSTGP